MKKNIIIITFILVVFVFFIYIISYKNNRIIPIQNLPGRVDEIMQKSSPSPTPFPFQEMTIPYLRNRTFQSQLGITEKYLDEGSYTSYLTSYDSDSYKINGLLTIPNSDRPEEGWPAVVFVHGYIPPQSYKTTQNYASFIDRLAKNGLVVFKIDLRGHGDSEGMASGAYYSGDYVIDTLNAYTALQQSEFVNRNKVYLWGHSMAGNVVFRSFVANADIPKVVIWAGAVYTYDDMAKYRISDNSYQPPPQESERRRKRQKLFNAYGEFDKNNYFWRLVVPVNFLEGTTGSLQIHHAVDDNVVNIGYSRDLVEILKNSDVTTEFFEYQNGGHNISGINFDVAMERTVNFFLDDE